MSEETTMTVRAVPAEIRRAARARAVGEGLSLRDVVVELLRMYAEPYDVSDGFAGTVTVADLVRERIAERR